MPADGTPENPGIGWAWLLRHPTIFEDDGRVTFVRGADSTAVFRAFGVDPGRAIPRTLVECHEPSGAASGGRPCVRVAVSGAWVAVAEPVRASTLPGTAASALSFGTDVVVATMNFMGQGWVSHLVDGRLRFGLEVGQAYDGLAGEAPARLAQPMREAGLIEREPPGDSRTEFVAAIAVLAREFGFSFSAEQLRGPLPTGYLPE